MSKTHVTNFNFTHQSFNKYFNGAYPKTPPSLSKPLVPLPPPPFLPLLIAGSGAAVCPSPLSLVLDRSRQLQGIRWARRLHQQVLLPRDPEPVLAAGIHRLPPPLLLYVRLIPFSRLLHSRPLARCPLLFAGKHRFRLLVLLSREPLADAQPPADRRRRHPALARKWCPDAFATITSFASSGVGEVGLSSVLGGAFFVTSGVVGLISVCVGPRFVTIDRFSFFREICFFMIVLCFLVGILIVGEIGLVGSIAFAFFYTVYVGIVAVSYFWRNNRGEFETPLLESVEIEEPICLPKQVVQEFKTPSCCICLLHFLELPLSLPRRLTIPDVSEERWSKPFAVASVILSPILLATLWNSKREGFGSEESLTAYLFAGVVGLVLGVVALETTESEKPPLKLLLPWLAAEFLMSVVWFYITAGELVSLLVSVGHILGIGPSILAVTILAWGNSFGDLIANVAMAVNGGEDGVQIAISGCYAVPIFNTLVGLGVSLVFTSWAAHPSPFVIPEDSSIMVTLGFLVCSLLWALVMLPKRGMKLDRVFGIGLLALYLCFLCLRISDSIGLVQIDDLLQ